MIVYFYRDEWEMIAEYYRYTKKNRIEEFLSSRADDVGPGAGD
jgi:hypothetical protein